MRRFARGDPFGCSGHHDFATRVTSLRAEIDHVIRSFDYIEVVLDQYHRVPGIH